MYQVACKIKINEKQFIDIFERNKANLIAVKSSDTYVKSDQASNVPYILRRVEYAGKFPKDADTIDIWRDPRFGINSYGCKPNYFNTFKKCLDTIRGINIYEVDVVELDNYNLFQYYKKSFETLTLDFYSFEFTDKKFIYTLTKSNTIPDCYLTCNRVYLNKADTFKHVSLMEQELNLQFPPESKSWIELHSEGIYNNIFSNKKYKNGIELFKAFESSYKYLKNAQLFESYKEIVTEQLKEKVYQILNTSKGYAGNF